LASAFSNYDFCTVARQDLQSLLEMGPIKNRRKVKGCLKNAGQLNDLVSEHGSFEAYLGSSGDKAHDVDAFVRMQRDMRRRFDCLG
jgi:3-methyladenine DNA glycosylase Tag